MTTITAKIAKDMTGLLGRVSVADIAARYGVSASTVYYHTNKDHAAKRRATWRQAQSRKKTFRIRRVFEAWAVQQPELVGHTFGIFQNGDYINPIVQLAWRAFSAPRNRVSETAH